MRKFRTIDLLILLLIINCIILIFSIFINVTCYNVFSSDGIIANSLNPNLDYLIVVNDDNPYEFGGEYDTELQQSLIYQPDIYGEATPIEKATYTAFLELQKYLSSQGMYIGFFSGYRTEEDQQQVYDYYSNLEGWSETNKVSLPGYSEHHTGLLMNIVIWYQGEADETPMWYTETAERQETIPYFQLLHNSLADYGFIDRYPAGKESITGYPSEPYEIRFVGSAATAHAIMNNDLTLEEYLAQN